MRISRRKRTDSGRIIPEWARRGEISLRQGGISGPVDSRLDFRIEPEGEGLVVVHFTGQTADGDLLDEVPCDEFPLGAGIHGILSLDNGSVPLFDRMHMGCERNRGGLAKRVWFSPEFEDHMTRFIRFVWGLLSPEILVVYALPEIWWLQWFERYPEMVQPRLEKASALMSLRHDVDPDTLRRLVLEDNPEFPDPTAEEEGFLQSELDREWPGEELQDLARPSKARPLELLKFLLQDRQGQLIHLTHGTKRYVGFVKDLDERLARFERNMRSSGRVESFDQEMMLLAITFLDAPEESVLDASTLLEWVKAFAGPEPRWWGERAVHVQQGDHSKLVSRLIGYWSIKDTSVLTPKSPLIALAGRSWSWFGPASLAWMLGRRPDRALESLIDGSEMTHELCRLAGKVARVRATLADREEDHQYLVRMARDWHPYRRLLQVFPESVRDRDFEAKGRDELPSFGELRIRFGVDDDDTVEQVIGSSEWVKEAFETWLQPLGLAVKDVQAARVLYYLLLWKARELCDADAADSGKGGHS